MDINVFNVGSNYSTNFFSSKDLWVSHHRSKTDGHMDVWGADICCLFHVYIFPAVYYHNSSSTTVAAVTMGQSTFQLPGMFKSKFQTS